MSVDTSAEMERLYRRIITLETALGGMIRAPFNGTSAMAMTLACGVMDHPQIEYGQTRDRCYCGAKER